MANQTPRSHFTLQQAPSNPNSSQVRVVLRVRPFLPTEIDKNQKGNNKELTPCVSFLDQHPTGEISVHLKDQYTSRNECYKLDSFFGQEDRAEQIFYKEVSSLISGIFEGVNATVFSYGATGSGKTYTMQGKEHEPGIIPLSISSIFSQCEKYKDCTVEISYYEVYLDRCYDLLEPKAKEIKALDDKDGMVKLKGLSKATICTMDEFCKNYSIATQRRKVAHTGLNDVSSRSHAILSIIVTNGSIKGKLNLIDLAGNEDNRRTGNDGIRLQESVKINQSLFALSNVIFALNNNQQRIPYRESKLTRILQDSVGGTSRALMIACLNPVSYQEAVHTVSLAARSRQVKNNVGPVSQPETPKVRVDMEAELRKWLESKGKVKSIQRMDSLLSPNKPGSVHLSSKSGSVPVRSALKKPVADREGLSITKKKISFDLGANLESHCTDRMEQPQVSLHFSIVTCCQTTEEKHMDIVNSIEETPCNKENLQQFPDIGTASPKNIPLQDSISRKPLSPIPSNTLDLNENIQTPLVRFNDQSSNLKESLVQDYLDFLNSANKEELMQLKGIGEKRAQYILEEREGSPKHFKSLSDLERIGLTPKQVKGLLKRTARGIFD